MKSLEIMNVFEKTFSTFITKESSCPALSYVFMSNFDITEESNVVPTPETEQRNGVVMCLLVYRCVSLYSTLENKHEGQLL